MTIFHVMQYPITSLPALLIASTGTDISDLPRQVVSSWQRRVQQRILAQAKDIAAGDRCTAAENAVRAAADAMQGAITRAAFYAAVESAEWETSSNAYFELYSLCCPEQDQGTWLRDLIYWMDTSHCWDASGRPRLSSEEQHDEYLSMLLEELRNYDE